jgi:hypothetical protein
MKANAVNDVIEHVAKIENRVEQLEVARAIAEGFKVPESLILERLKLTPRRPDIRPLARTAATKEADRKLTFAEKQLIQALLQGTDIANALLPFLESDFGTRIWARQVLENLVKDPARNIENALVNVQDNALKHQVRAAVLEPFGQISNDQALDSVKRLYDGHLVQKLEEIAQQLKQYEPGPAPTELIQKKMEIVAERNRVAAFKA